MPLTNIRDDSQRLQGQDLQCLYPATYFVRERQEYIFELDEGADGLTLNGKPCETLVANSRYYRICIIHALGLVCLQQTRAGRPFGDPIWIEVYSYKFETPRTHFDFYTTIVRDLFQQAASLPFSFENLTQRGVAESPRLPTLLFTYHFLAQNLENFQAAIAIILADPHRLLCDFPHQVRLHEVNEVDGDVILSILHTPETWAPADPARLAIASALQVDGRGYAPTRVWQRLPEETFDTQENRFILFFLRQVLTAAEAMPHAVWWEMVRDHPRSKRILELAALLRETVTHPMFVEVGELHHIPYNSQVLMRREGYRDAFRLWQQFHSAAHPLFDRWQQAMDVRNMHQLYEIWVFFKLAGLIGGCNRMEPVITDVDGLEYGETLARFENGGCLYYNRRFHPNHTNFHSYSMVLRPDYAWVGVDGTLVILDAKFSMQVEETGLAGDAVIDGEDDPPQENRVGTPVREDLYKMHTYRDALTRSVAAVILYPGDVQVFMPNSGNRISNVPIDSLLSGKLEGIGAIPLKP